MAFKDGDFVKVDYSLWRTADNELMRTTEKKLAEEKGIYNEEVRYMPQLIIIGKDNALKALWDALKTMDVGQSRKLELEPKDAFGERDQNLVRVMPVADFRKKEIEPRPGMQIDIDGVIATIKSVNSGRVMVDANNPLAGEKVRYELRVVSKVEKDDEKVKVIAETYALEPDRVEMREGQARVFFGLKTKMNADYFVNKNYLVNAVLEYMPDVKKVVVEEEYERLQEKK
ncbi:MAG TPA: peptidylprolyl isomerase [Candidatus Saccharimonadales bacterium]|nr:peptidylprolyl isomerase [Candidatus Saccharimonadales bacterium]